MTEKRIKINLDYLKPNSRLIYPLYSKTGEKVISAREELTHERIALIELHHGKEVYYREDESHSPLSRTRMENAVERSRSIIHEISMNDTLRSGSYRQAEKIAEDIVDDVCSAPVYVLNLMKDLKTFDEYLFYHSVNVSALTAVLGRQSGAFKVEELRALTLGAYLHDIGEKKLDRQLLNKAGKLDISEMQKVKRHPQLGYEILKEVESNPVILQTVLFHHERFNDRGYYGLPYDNLPIYPKMLSLCDVYDAMTSRRPYRPNPIIRNNAFKTLLNSTGISFDYELVKQFIVLMSPVLNYSQSFYSLKDLCEIDGQELGIITSFGFDDILRPKVLVFCRFTRQNGRLTVKFYDVPRAVDLSVETEKKMTRILTNQEQIRLIYRMLKDRKIVE